MFPVVAVFGAFRELYAQVHSSIKAPTFPIIIGVVGILGVLLKKADIVKYEFFEDAGSLIFRKAKDEISRQTRSSRMITFTFLLAVLAAEPLTIISDIVNRSVNVAPEVLELMPLALIMDPEQLNRMTATDDKVYFLTRKAAGGQAVSVPDEMEVDLSGARLEPNVNLLPFFQLASWLQGNLKNAPDPDQAPRIGTLDYLNTVYYLEAWEPSDND